MPKTGLKTFVYSFSVSLLTIFTVNGIYWHTTSSSQTDLAIPSQNITLFLNRHADNPSPRPVPVKKIALTVLPTVKHTAENGVHLPAAEPEIIMADVADILEIPLEFGTFSSESEEMKPQKIAANYEQIIHNPPPPAATLKTESHVKPATNELSKIYKDVEIAAVSKSPDRGVLAGDKIAKPKKQSVGNSAIPVRTPESAVLGAGSSSGRASNAGAEILTAEAGNVPMAGNTQVAQAVRPIQDNDDKLPTPKAVLRPEPLLMAETDSGAIIPLQRVRDVWAGRNENIKISDHGSPNQVALADSNVPIKSMTSKNNAAKQDIPQNSPDEEEWEKMAEKVNSDSPWTVAKSAGKSRNEMLAKEKFYQADSFKVHEALGTDTYSGGEIKVASETVKNLLIPIPEDILNDENLTPQLVSSKNPDDISKEVEEEPKEAVRPDQLASTKKENATIKTVSADEKILSAEETDNSPLVEKDKKKTILNSLSSIFSSSTNVKEKKQKSREGGIFDNLRRKIAGRNKVKIMPTEMRLSFQPNRAEISGQTLRWIQAFATRAAEDDRMMIEIRIDGTSAMELQQKRLNLLHNILTNKGVEYSKINTVFTQREPNSFIIRTVRLNNTTTGGNGGNINRATQGYYLQW